MKRLNPTTLSVVLGAVALCVAIVALVLAASEDSSTPPDEPAQAPARKRAKQKSPEQEPKETATEDRDTGSVDTRSTPVLRRRVTLLEGAVADLNRRLDDTSEQLERLDSSAPADGSDEDVPAEEPERPSVPAP